MNGIPPEYKFPNQDPSDNAEELEELYIERRELGKIPTALLLLLLLVASVAIPFSGYMLTSPSHLSAELSNGIAAIVSVILAVYLGRSCRATKGILPLIVFFGIMIFMSMGSVIPALAILSLLFVISEGALLLTVSPKKDIPLFIILPVAAYGISFAICGFDPVIAILSLIPIPTAVTLSLSTRSTGKKDGLTRTGAICATAFCLGATLTVGIVALLYAALGSLSADAVLGFVNELRTELIRALASISFENAGEVFKPFTEELAADYVNSAFNILPGSAVTAVAVFAFFANTVLLGALRTAGFIERPVKRMFNFTMSIISAVVYAVAFIILLIDSTNASSSLEGTVANNIAIIFQPGLALCGIESLTKLLVEKKQGCGLVLLAGAIMLMSCVFNYMLLMLAAVGAIFIIFDTVKKLLASKKKNDHDQNM